MNTGSESEEMNTCANHKGVKAETYCRECGKFFCSACGVDPSVHSHSCLGGTHETTTAQSHPVNDFCQQSIDCTEHMGCPLDSFCKDCTGK